MIKYQTFQDYSSQSPRTEVPNHIDLKQVQVESRKILLNKPGYKQAVVAMWSNVQHNSCQVLYGMR